MSFCFQVLTRASSPEGNDEGENYVYAIEAGVAGLDALALKERIAGLKVIRDQARTDADRTQAILGSPGHSAITPTTIQGSAARPRTYPGHGGRLSAGSLALIGAACRGRG